MRLAREALYIMRAVEGEPYADVLSMMMPDPCNKLAIQSTITGHYGLAADYYSLYPPYSPLSRPPCPSNDFRDYGRSKRIAEHFEQVIPECDPVFQP